jgi:hypothetical protein
MFKGDSPSTDGRVRVYVYAVKIAVATLQQRVRSSVMWQDIHKYIHTFIHTYMHTVETPSAACAQLCDTARRTYIHMYIHTYVQWRSPQQRVLSFATRQDIHTYIHTYTHSGDCRGDPSAACAQLCDTARHTYTHTYTHTYIHTYIYSQWRLPRRPLSSVCAALRYCKACMGVQRITY